MSLSLARLSVAPGVLKLSYMLSVYESKSRLKLPKAKQ